MSRARGSLACLERGWGRPQLPQQVTTATPQIRLRLHLRLPPNLKTRALSFGRKRICFPSLRGKNKVLQYKIDERRYIVWTLCGEFTWSFEAAVYLSSFGAFCNIPFAIILTSIPFCKRYVRRGWLA